MQTPGSVELRQLKAGDATAFRSLRQMGLQEAPSAFGESIAEFAAKSMEQVAHMLDHHQRGDFVLGAFEAQQLVGIVGFFTHSNEKMAHKGTIWGMYVKPSHRSQRIASLLLKAAMDKAATIPGLRQLDLTVVLGNPVARRLYENAGFRVTGTETAALRVNGRDVDWYFMQKAL